MAQVKPKSVKTDTTKIKTPYKVERGELVVLSVKNNLTPDSTKKKIAYNLNQVTPSVIKRNMERRKEGKEIIPTRHVYGGGNGVVSTKGKTFKEAPIKSKKKLK